jgi:hypothetical protein
VGSPFELGDEAAEAVAWPGACVLGNADAGGIGPVELSPLIGPATGSPNGLAGLTCADAEVCVC